MSIEAAKAFIEKVKTDAELAKKVKESEDADSKLQIAKQEGYEFTAEEAKRVQEELTEEDLDSVAGGVLGTGGGSTFCLIHW
ncbi:MAG: Nif11-like leader peptide family RiPP precursor [Desulfohalobiaceae bacterium]